MLEPAGLTNTRFDLPEADQQRAMQGHNFDGSPMPFIPTSPMIVGAGGLYSTANDMLRWLSWHLDRFGTKEAEMLPGPRLLFRWRLPQPRVGHG